MFSWSVISKFLLTSASYKGLIILSNIIIITAIAVVLLFFVKSWKFNQSALALKRKNHDCNYLYELPYKAVLSNTENYIGCKVILNGKIESIKKNYCCNVYHISIKSEDTVEFGNLIYSTYCYEKNEMELVEGNEIRFSGTIEGVRADENESIVMPFIIISEVIYKK